MGPFSGGYIGWQYIPVQHDLVKPYIGVFLDSLGRRATSNTGALGTFLIFCGALLQLCREGNKDPPSSPEGSMAFQWLR